MRIRKCLFMILIIVLGSVFCPDKKVLCMGTKPTDAPKITGTAGARGVDEEEEGEKKGIETNIEEEEIVITKAELDNFLKEGGLERWRK